MQCAKKNEAFTLVEILAVVVIIGILATLMLPRVAGIWDKVKMMQTKATMATIEAALQEYNQDIGHFPDKKEGDLEALITQPRDEKIAKRWKGPYLKGGEIPADQWGHEFEYNKEANIKNKDKGFKYFELISYGAVGEEGNPNDWVIKGE